jgi:hypothetical protein
MRNYFTFVALKIISLQIDHEVLQNCSYAFTVCYYP